MIPFKGMSSLKKYILIIHTKWIQRVLLCGCVIQMGSSMTLNYALATLVLQMIAVIWEQAQL